MMGNPAALLPARRHVKRTKGSVLGAIIGEALLRNDQRRDRIRRIHADYRSRR